MNFVIFLLQLHRVQYIYNIYHGFFNDKLTLFDDKYLFETQEENLKFKAKLFNAIFLSNSKMINISG